jgi:hypothetical protein
VNIALGDVASVLPQGAQSIDVLDTLGDQISAETVASATVYRTIAMDRGHRGDPAFSCRFTGIDGRESQPPQQN